MDHPLTNHEQVFGEINWKLSVNVSVILRFQPLWDWSFHMWFLRDFHKTFSNQQCIIFICSSNWSTKLLCIKIPFFQTCFPVCKLKIWMVIEYKMILSSYYEQLAFSHSQYSLRIHFYLSKLRFTVIKEALS